jgi:hypothetical protein
MIGRIEPSEIEALMDKLVLNNSEFGALFGVTSGAVFNWCTGRRAPTPFMAELMKLGLRLSEERANYLELDKVILRQGAIKAFAKYVNAISAEMGVGE